MTAVPRSRALVLAQVLERSCEDRLGYPDCMGQLNRGVCCCPSTLTETEHDHAIALAWLAWANRRGKCCHDCAFRRDAPEEGATHKIAALEVFYCHQGMPLANDDAYVPRFTADGRPIGYPVCAGWLVAQRPRSRSAA